MYNGNGSSPSVTNCTFSGNATGQYDGGGGGMYNTSSSPTVTNCTFSGNTVSWSGGLGGGMYNHASSSPTVANCTFSGNRADYGSGGGMYNGNGTSAAVVNCAFSGNTAGGDGGGISNYASSSLTLNNCTFSGNTARTGVGGGMFSYQSSPTVSNCIFWDNSAPLGDEIYKASGSPTFSHCDIRGSGGSGALWDTALGVDGGGNIRGDPRFVAPATPAGPDGLWRTRDDGLRLQSNSPCIGAADPALAPQKDILGLARGAAADIGAYEYFLMPPASADSAWLLFK